VNINHVVIMLNVVFERGHYYSLTNLNLHGDVELLGFCTTLLVSYILPTFCTEGNDV
jgi:hypothetical protein